MKVFLFHFPFHYCLWISIFSFSSFGGGISTYTMNTQPSLKSNNFLISFSGNTRISGFNFIITYLDIIFTWSFYSRDFDSHRHILLPYLLTSPFWWVQHCSYFNRHFSWPPVKLNTYWKLSFLLSILFYLCFCFIDL